MVIFEKLKFTSLDPNLMIHVVNKLLDTFGMSLKTPCQLLEKSVHRVLASFLLTLMKKDEFLINNLTVE